MSSIPPAGISVAVSDSALRDIIIGTARPAAVVFSMKSADNIDSRYEASKAAGMCLDHGYLDQLLTALDRRRILILSAAPDSGKGATALALAHALKQLEKNAKLTTRRIRPLDVDTRLDLPARIRNGKSVASTVLLFKDALARKNRDLDALFRSLDEALVTELSEQLAAQSAYIIFSVDAETLEQQERGLVALGICHQVPRVSEPRRREWLSQFLPKADGPNSIRESDVGEILRRADSMPKLLRFVQTYLPQVLKGDLSIGDACGRLTAGAAERFHGELADDFERWSFTFILVLALAVRPEDGVPWTEFEELRRLMMSVIRSRVRGSRRIRDYRRENASDTMLIRAALAVVERDAETGRDVIKFPNTGDVEALWQNVLDNNRSLLTALYPKLLACVNQTLDVSSDTRRRAAQIIGRIGQMDPAAFTMDALFQCGKEENMSVRASGAYILEGVGWSSDARYKLRCINVLDRMANINEQSDTGRALIWSAIAACKRLATWNMEEAMRILRGIAERNLADRLAAVRDLQRQRQGIDAAFLALSREGAAGTEELAGIAALIRAASAAIFADRAPLLFAIQYTLVAMCITLDPIEVLGKLRKWMLRPGGLRAMTALIYLQSGGIAAASSEYQENPDDERADCIEINPIVLALIREPAQAKSVASFLESVFVCYRDEFPSQSLPGFHTSFVEHLLNMAVQCQKSKKALDAVETLFVQVLRCRTTELQELLVNGMRQDQAFTKQGTPLGKFAERVVEQSLRTQ